MANENALWDRSDDTNPYAPPEAALDVEPGDLIPPGDLAAAEAIRKAYIRHEASVKSIGTLHYLGAIGGLLGTGGLLGALLVARNRLGPMESVFLIIGGLMYAALGGLHLALGIGLRRLQTWARWTDVGLIALVLALYGILAMVGVAGIAGGSDAASVVGLFSGIFFVYVIFGYILYLLLAAKAKTIFSAEYKTIIAQTPHIRYRTRRVLKVALALLVGLIVLAVIGAIVGSSR